MAYDLLKTDWDYMNWYQVSGKSAENIISCED